ncbi:MAG: hypothetical protein K9G76_09065 [Bacteroidales bacterium]|nr:hypothetical protein [Bacteroidales bacterium]MCF8403700.1 hypothetical protein [Bacteroidales bacterium]
MKYYIYKVGFSILMVLFLSASLMAQKPKFNFKKIDQPEGLSNSTVQTFFEDSFGFIWIGTQHGVQRYDGKTFVNYEHLSGDTIGLTSNDIYSFCEDIDKNIWISTGEGLNKYIREKDLVLRYHLTNEGIFKYGSPSILRIVNDISDKDILWMTVANVGLVSLNVKNDSLKIYALQSIKNFSPSWILKYPGDDNKFLLGNSELLVFDKTSGGFEQLLKLEQNTEVPNNLINDARIDPSDKDIIWLATGDFWGRGNLGDLIRYNLKTREKILFSPETRNDFPDRNLMVLCFSDSNNLWIGTRSIGALLYKIDEDRFYNFKNNPYDEASMATETSVRSMLIDRSGTFWFGTWGDGISLLSPTVQKFKHYKNLPGQKNSLSDNIVNSFAEDKKGFIWIATEKGGLSKFDPEKKTFENYFKELSSTGNLSTAINFVFYDSHENLWVGTYNQALYRYNPETGEKIHYKKGSTDKDVTQRRISTITEIVPGEIIISTYGGGLNIYNYKTNSFKHYLNDPSDSTSIPDNQCWLPFGGTNGNYYFSGNSTAGLIQFNSKTETFHEVHPLNGISTFMMPAITSDGRVFIDDVSEGLRELVLKPNVKTITQYDSQGKGLKNVESILVDENNHLWMGTGNGLIDYDPVSMTAVRYYAADGLQDNKFNRFAIFKSSSGDFYVGGKNGFSIFRPEDMKQSQFQPPIVFTDFKLYQKDVPIGNDSPLKKSITLLNHLELDYNQNDFSFSFAALDFSNPEKIEYKYTLENHDDDWIFAGPFNTAGYTNMDPGSYTLKVMATNSDGVWSGKTASMNILIHPPWYQTTLAYLIYGLMFIIGVVMIDRIQRRRLKEKEKAMAREKELAQAKEIQKAYTELKSTQAQLIQSEKMASLGELTAGIAHEIQNPLNFVNNFSEVNSELIEELKEEAAKGDMKEVLTIADDIANNEKKIIHHGKRADSIVKGMLQHSRTSNNEKELTDINSLADEYLRLSYHGLRAKDKTFNADFKTEFDESIPNIKVIPQDIGRVFLNLINNAFYAVSAASSKASTKENPNFNPRVIISTKKLKDKIEIRVKDNGIGIPSELKDKIFQPFFTTKPTGEGTGLGLSLSYDIITKGHNGDLTLNTKAGEGTEFIIVLPEN